MFLSMLYVAHKDTVYTSQRTQRASIRKNNRLLLYRKILAVYCIKYACCINTLRGENALFQCYTWRYTYFALGFKV